MSVTTPQPTRSQPGAAGASAAANAVRVALRARRRTVGVSLAGLPVANLVMLEIGLAIGLALISVSRLLLPVAAAVLLVALVIGLLRWRRRWLTQWLALVGRYALRPHTRVATITAPDETVLAPSLADAEAEEAPTVIGPEDQRVALLRLAVPDLVVAQGTDHERRPLGMAWHAGGWTAVLLVDPVPAPVTHVGAAPNLPLGALAPCLEDRGVVLDAIQVIWHCYPGSASLPSRSPALASYLEVLGPLPAAARRTTWVAVRLDPKRCVGAIAERGGGVVGAHRALIGALSRVRSALGERGVPTRPLAADELLKAGLSAAELTAVAGGNRRVGLRERWGRVASDTVGHSSYAITGWPHRGTAHSLNALTGVRALSSTVAMSISPGDGEEVGLRGLVRVSARTPGELGAADERLRAIAGRLGITLTPLRGQQLAGLAATLPLGGTS
ncbi:type VII secretion protein EccE [Gandjariella thermophila]|uniref:Type VII secretion protein EccE n=1 Tax=Gandjariella thermophila TaxID=1931992 RepID=A0A4D4J3I0_9PSEU|nr:type VII secretion protein EccE [Gandjariella thermophila]